MMKIWIHSQHIHTYTCIRFGIQSFHWLNAILKLLLSWGPFLKWLLLFSVFEAFEHSIVLHKTTHTHTQHIQNVNFFSIQKGKPVDCMATEIIRDRIFFWIERNRIENYLWNYFKNNFFCLEISWAFIVDRLWSRRDGINEKFSGKVNRDRFSIEKKKKTEQRRVLGCDKFLLDIFEYLILDVCVCDGDTLLPHTHTHTISSFHFLWLFRGSI